MRAQGVIYVFCFALLLCCGCRNDREKLFTRLDASETGIAFNNLNIETETVNIFTYEYLYNGGGVAVGDVNNDGLPDIYFTANSEENKLYLNRGNLKFEDITSTSGTACAQGWKTGVTMADINGDGWLDIYVSRSGHRDPQKRKNILLINNGDLTFSDQSEQYGLDDESYSTQAAFFDWDRDGDLDVMLLNHSLLAISNSYDISRRNTQVRYPHVGNRLLRNDGGRFTDVSDSAGVFGPASNYGLGLSLSDINNDGWIDAYAGCDYTGRDKLLLNDHGRRYVDATDTLLSHISKFTMGTDIADFNGDGLMDIYTLDMLPEDNRRQKQLMGSDRYDAFAEMVKSGLHSQYMRNMLHLNNGDGTFSEIGQLSGVSNTDWSWAALFADFDNDGTQDLFVTNGFKRDLTDNDFAKFKAFQEIVNARRQGRSVTFMEVINKFNENKIPNYIFKGNGDLTFSDMTAAWGLDHATLSNGAAYADLDNDGDLDLITNNMNEHAGVYRNNAEGIQSNFLKVTLAGGDRNRFAIGAKVTVHAGNRTFTRELLPARGFQSSVDPALHFGLGALSAIDSVVVRWPEGGRQLLAGISPKKHLFITRNAENKTVQSSPGFRNDSTAFTERPDAVAFRHAENNFNDFRIQALLPRMYSTEGPALAVADVNGDDTQDVYFGGASGQSGELFLQSAGGTYQKHVAADFSIDMRSEDTDAKFFDADGDLDMDLYVCSGGYEFPPGDDALQDRLYLNDGKAGFRKVGLPSFRSSSSCVRPADFDRDGDTDLFIGGRVIPGRYPESPRSYLLVNDGIGNFTLGDLPRGAQNAGMVTDALWADINGDAWPDLVLVGEWMPVRIFINDNGKLADRSANYLQDGTEGLWNTIIGEDFDNDGDIDLVAGNTGRNTQMRASRDKPVTVLYDDFDENGSVDPILGYFIGEKSYPYPSRDELTEQVPSFKKRFPDYASYSNATMEEVLTEEETSRSGKLFAYTLESAYFRNEGNHFSVMPLPARLQFAPVFALAAMDINHDGYADLISGGNLSGARARTGKMTGNTTFVFLGDGKGAFSYLPSGKSGLAIDGDVRKLVAAGDKLWVAVNNTRPRLFSLRQR